VDCGDEDQSNRIIFSTDEKKEIDETTALFRQNKLDSSEMHELVHRPREKHDVHCEGLMRAAEEEFT
jgi:hypothetical protein